MNKISHHMYLEAQELTNHHFKAAFASMVEEILEKIFNKKPFSWGKTNLATTGDARSMYIKALKKADNYDYEAFLKFVRS